MKIAVHFKWTASDLIATEPLDDAVDIVSGEDAGNAVILHGASTLIGNFDDMAILELVMGEK